MITGNTTWETKLAASPRKALYALVIDDMALWITNFDPAAESVTSTGGYGTAYGTAYGSD